jgi:hypothetical protein
MAAWRLCSSVVKVILTAGLLAWALAAPLVWILRDGLGPKMVETAGAQAVVRFAVGWAVPALVIAVPLALLWFLERRLAGPAREGRPTEG